MSPRLKARCRERVFYRTLPSSASTLLYLARFSCRYIHAVAALANHSRRISPLHPSSISGGQPRHPVVCTVHSCQARVTAPRQEAHTPRCNLFLACVWRSGCTFCCRCAHGSCMHHPPMRPSLPTTLLLPAPSHYTQLSLLPVCLYVCLPATLLPPSSPTDLHNLPRSTLPPSLALLSLPRATLAARPSGWSTRATNGRGRCSRCATPDR